jgi:hypothetical protein
LLKSAQERGRQVSSSFGWREREKEREGEGEGRERERREKAMREEGVNGEGEVTKGKA